LEVYDIFQIRKIFAHLPWIDRRKCESKLSLMFNDILIDKIRYRLR